MEAAPSLAAAHVLPRRARRSSELRCIFTGTLPIALAPLPTAFMPLPTVFAPLPTMRAEPRTTGKRPLRLLRTLRCGAEG
ncbi:MAG: hypothetical protein DWQ31_16700 [Planctomycetota bacterium]|nr:MAG: hypothetical protein DWQ31_16700 [Planctomycetota bacterium]